MKHQKTLDANQKALKAAEKKAQAALKSVRSSAAALVISRKPFWFERFHWFISSENYLVLSGRDAQQNELLVKRYMRCGAVRCGAVRCGAVRCGGWVGGCGSTAGSGRSVCGTAGGRRSDED